VGYTNAGKSTLFRTATGADVYVANQLFATLDPTVRRVQLPGGANVVLADTVGFIRELPHELVAAFQSTLTEARHAHLLLHVIDASDARRDEYIEQVNAVLNDIGAGDLPQLRVYNKIDRLGVEPRAERDENGVIRQIWLSAATGAGIDLLRQAIAERLEVHAQRHWLHVPAAAGALRARLHAADTVREERSQPDGSLWLMVDLPAAELERIARQPGVRVAAAPPADPSACEAASTNLESQVPSRRTAARRRSANHGKSR
jgi:GTP-binding protein HflX